VNAPPSTPRPTLPVTAAGDPSRIAAGICSGVGFLGAATIFKGEAGTADVTGLSTAAGIWTVAAIGTAVGYGYYAVGGMTTALIVVVQHGLLFFFSPKFWKMFWEAIKATGLRGAPNMGEESKSSLRADPGNDGEAEHGEEAKLSLPAVSDQ